MAKGKTKSPYDKETRKQMAFERFSQGYRNSQIAEELMVGADTVARYRAEYEAGISGTAADNPGLLADAIGNTVRVLTELDLVRTNAWQRINDGRVVMVACENCEHETEFKAPIADQTRAQLLNTILKAQDQRAKLYGLFGVQPEFLRRVAAMQAVQRKLMEFLTNKLPEELKPMVEQFLLEECGPFLSDAHGVTLEPVLELPESSIEEILVP